MLDKVIGLIEAQQAGKERTAPWMVGEQLKDMLRGEPHLAEIVATDLEKEDMGLEECEKQIKALADKNKKGNFACVTPLEAERVIREFYGLPPGGERGAAAAPTERKDNILSIADFF